MANYDNSNDSKQTTKTRLPREHIRSGVSSPEWLQTLRSDKLQRQGELALLRVGACVTCRGFWWTGGEHHSAKKNVPTFANT